MRVVIAHFVLATSLYAGRAAAFEGALFCADPHASLACELESPSHELPAESSGPACMPDSPLELLLPAMSEADVTAARISFERASALYDSGDLDEALLHLRVVERLVPRVADRIASQRGHILLRLGLPEQACEAFAIARQSPDRGVATQAEIDSARCLLQARDKTADAALQTLTRRYPNLGERHSLRLLLARARQEAGQLSAAATLFRSIDLEVPGSREGAEARGALAELAARGVRVRPLTGLELADRAERLWRDGDVESSAAVVDGLLADGKLTAEAQGRLHVLRARIARQQGDWERALTETHEARRAGAADAGKLVPPTPLTVRDEPDQAEARQRAEKHARELRGTKPVAKLSTPQLRTLFDLAARYRMQPLLDEVTLAMAGRTSVLPSVRFELAMRAAGLAGDAALASLLGSLVDAPGLRVPARYHLARAYERAGRRGEAEAAYMRVMAEDRGSTPYYALWAALRLRALRDASASANAAGVDTEPGYSNVLVPPSDDRAALPTGLVGLALRPPLAAGAETAIEPEEELALGDELGVLDFLDAEELGKRARLLEPEPDLDDRTRIERVRELLTPIVAEHGEAYPWLGRALDLTELGAFDEAADEMSEAYLAWRDAIGAPRLRSGLLALLTGNAPPRRPAAFAVRAGRRALDVGTRADLSKVARLLGDPGIGLRLGAFRPDLRPRAYAPLVEAAARKHGIDPNLLFAVMRVESIYNRRIISTAGAIGLMQIMPGTGKRIAQRVGVEGFSADDLLDPALNVDFAAWYLASLLERFDGSLPLAIASYNGGPHNVRLWMRQSGPDMPLDAFLERIPFSQTHRYVRRVLTHYAAYRAQQHLPMTTLALELPEQQPDEIAF